MGPYHDIELTLMGVFAIRHDTRRVQLHIRGKTLSLLMLLASSANKNLRKEAIIEEIWNDQDPCKSRSAFNTAIWRLKAALTKFQELEIICDGDLIKLSTHSNVFIDAQVLQSTLPAISKFEYGEDLSNAEFQLFENLSNKCNGEFLEGFHAHWTLARRELLSNIFIRLLSCLMRHHAESNHFEQALHFGRKILTLDPFREITQREVMQLYALNGERAKAVRQYKMLKTLLNNELGIEPLQETRDTFNSIAQDNAHTIIFRRPSLAQISPRLA